jgi:hypothetical protein
LPPPAFLPPAVIQKIAPYVDAVDVGVKGSLGENFYTRFMRAPGGAEAVKAALRAWRDAGVYLLISDLIANHKMQDDEAHTAAQDRFYAWIAEALGPHTSLLIGHMHAPADADKLLVPPGTEAAYMARFDAAYERAHAAGLAYAFNSYTQERMDCHNCGELLLQLRGESHCAGSDDCTMFRPIGCDCFGHEEHVTGGRCDHCGAAVPIVTAG